MKNLTDSIQAIQKRQKDMWPVLGERARRLFAAAEARALGRGGPQVVEEATGIARSTINRGIKELELGLTEVGRQRRKGGGRKKKTVVCPALVDDLKSLVEPHTSGSPMRGLLWVSLSLEHLAEALKAKGHIVSTYVIRFILKSLEYSLQANRKTHEGGNHPDRDAQFLYIADQQKKYLAAGNPILSVDGKKKELIGNYKNNGIEWRPKNTPEKVNVYDFVDPQIGRATPYGVFDIVQNKGLVVLGLSFDTARFAVNCLRQWWIDIGNAVYARATGILITADGGGSNGYRVRLWKIELQILANEWGLPITVCHFPPGTSKWNPIEHKMFSYISINWRGAPLRTLDIAANYIRSTTTKSGLEIEAQIDPTTYEKGIKISDKEIRAVNIAKHDFHGEWNYTIFPQPPPYFCKH